MSSNPFQAPANPFDQESSGTSKVSPEEADVIAKKIKKLNTISFAFAIPGIVMQIAGRSNPLLALLGLILVLIGFACYAKMKGRSPVWSILSVFSFFGLIVLAVLPKYCHHCQQATGKGKTCQHCDAPAPL